MSNAAQALVWAHSKATGTARLVMLAIADHDGEGGSWPSYARLAAFANVDIRNARRAVERLVELGELKVVTGAGGRAQTPDYARPNLYVINLTCPPFCDHSSQHRDTRAGRRPRFQDVGRRAAADAIEATDEPVDNSSDDPGAVAPGEGGSAQGVGAVAPRGVGALAPSEPSLEPPYKSESVTQLRSTRTRDDDVCSFGHPLVDVTGGGVPICAKGDYAAEVAS